MRKSKGFTLIELLIVIIIIGILATIAVVSYGSASAKAKRVATLQTLNDAISAAAVCSANSDTVLTVLPGNVCNPTTTTNATWPTIRATGLASVLNGYYNNAGTAVAAATTETSGAYDYGTLVLTNGTPAYNITCAANKTCN